MRDATSNPFTPGSDIVPDVWAGRNAQLRDWADTVYQRLLRGLPERGRTIVGEPGLGKSTLVRRIAADVVRKGGWATRQIRLPSGTDPLKAVAQALLVLADEAGLSASREDRIKTALARVRQIAVKGFSLTLDRADGPEPHVALTDLLVEVGREARRREKVVLVHVDEVQNVTDDDAQSQLLIALGDAITHLEKFQIPGGVIVDRPLPIAVYLTGLPEFAARASSRTGATFARRFATTTLEPISDDDIRFALEAFVFEGWEVSDEHGGTAKVYMAQDAADRIVDLCHGEPFLFQLAGERAWYASIDSTITEDDVLTGWEVAKIEAAAHVERILERLPDKERELVRAMAELPPASRTAKTIAQSMGYQAANNIGPFAQRLDTVRGIISRGAPYRFRHRALEAYLTTNWPEA